MTATYHETDLLDSTSAPSFGTSRTDGHSHGSLWSGRLRRARGSRGYKSTETAAVILSLPSLQKWTSIWLCLTSRQGRAFSQQERWLVSERGYLQKPSKGMQFEESRHWIGIALIQASLSWSPAWTPVDIVADCRCGWTILAAVYSCISGPRHATAFDIPSISGMVLQSLRILRLRHSPMASSSKGSSLDRLTITCREPPETGHDETASSHQQWHQQAWYFCNVDGGVAQKASKGPATRYRCKTTG